MSCTQCGSSVPCSCSQQVISSTGRGCVTACACGNPHCCGTCGCGTPLPASPLPFYACAPACPENHKQTIITQQFYFDLAAQNTWNIPDCGETAVLYVPGLKSVNIGSYIWNSTYGYFEITSFDLTTNQITVINHCNENNAAPGTNVPACTKFTVTDPPFTNASTSDSCVAIDFTAPVVGDCIPITLTNLDSIQAGDIIQIGDGRYTVDSIDSIEVITICNEGLGLIPGTPVIALDAAGNYQYCIAVVESCCSRIQEEFPDGLTPCSNFENVGTASQDVSTQLDSPTLTNGDVSTTNFATVVFQNTSTCRTMQVFVTITQYFLPFVISTTGSSICEILTQVSVNGGPTTTVLQMTDNWTAGYGSNHITNPIYTQERSIPVSEFYGVAPGSTLTLVYKGVASVVATGDGGTILSRWRIAASGIGIAV